MAHLSLTPQLCADLLIGAFFLTEAVRWRWRRSPLYRSERGTTLVYWGCYVTTLLTLNFATPSQLTAETPVGWLGVMAATGGLARMLATLAAARTSATQSVGNRGHPHSLGHLVF